MEMTRTQELDALEAALGQPLFLLFKHSPTCPISARAYHEYRCFLENQPSLATAWLHVVEERPLSQWVAGHTGIDHQSPQALLFVRGEVAWHASHGDITRPELEEVLGSVLGSSPPGAPGPEDPQLSPGR